MTALDSLDHKLKGFEVGGVDYITKPFQIEEAMARIQTHLMIFHLQNRLKEKMSNSNGKSLNAKKVEAALKTANHELERLAVLDGLTQVANRRRFDLYLREQWEATVGEEFSLIMCDIDHFMYNDHYGHLAGDDCLKQVALALCRAADRPNALLARYGGEEFAFILPQTSREEAAQIAVAAMAEIAALQIPHAHSKTAPHVTLIFGVSSRITIETNEMGTLIQAADKCLYAAKKQGRNRLVMDKRGKG